MKTRVRIVFSLLAVAAVLAIPSVYAQTTVALEADIPFDFTVGNSVYSAGAYSLQAHSAPSAMLIQNVDTRNRTLILTHAVRANKPPSEGKLVFHRCGNRYFLSQVWTPGVDTGRELPKSKAEQEMALSYATADPVVVAAALR